MPATRPTPILAEIKAVRAAEGLSQAEVAGVFAKACHLNTVHKAQTRDFVIAVTGA